MKKLFGSVDFIHCLVRFGFTAQKQHSTNHIKFTPPKTHKIPIGIRPFMIVQLNKKQFDRHTCSRYITELVTMGFDKTIVLENLNK